MVGDGEPPSFPATGVLPPGPAGRTSSVLIEAGKDGGLNLGLLFAALTKLRLENHLQMRSALDMVLPALEFFVVAVILVGMLLPTGKLVVSTLSHKPPCTSCSGSLVIALWKGHQPRLGMSSRARTRQVAPGPAPCSCAVPDGC